MSVIIGAIAIIIHLLKPTKAEPTPPATCIDLSIPITVSANNAVYDTPRIDSNIDVADWMWDTYTWSHANLTSRVNGTIHVKETFNISGKLCVPHKGRKADILQIATHGIAFDKRFSHCKLSLPTSHTNLSSAGTGTCNILDKRTTISTQHSRTDTLSSPTIE